MMRFPNVIAKHNWATIRALADNEAEILIYGDIGENWYAEESITAKKIVETLSALDVEYLTVRINSVGGVVSDAIAIFNAIRRHSAAVTVEIDGIAMSAASMIAMSGDTVRMAENAVLMIHAPWGYAAGNAEELRKYADVLDTFSEAMSTAYARPGITHEEALALLSDGEDHYYTAAEAQDAGFVDEITEAMAIAASFDLSRFHKLPAAAAAFTRKQEHHSMSKPDPKPAADPKPADNVADIQAAAARKAREQIQARNKELKALFELPAFARDKAMQEIYQAALQNPETTVEQVRKEAMAKMGEGQSPVGGLPPHIEHGQDEGEKFVAAASAALLARMGAVKHDTANPYRGMRLHEIARACLERAGAHVNGMTPEEFAPMALSFGPVRGAQTTSDFPVILENTLHKMVLTGHEAVPITYDRFCRIGDVTDFRPWQRLTPGLIGNLDSVNEAGEYKNKPLPDAEKQPVQATRKGNIISVTPEVLVNDDLGQIQQQAMELGMAGPRTIERAVYALLESNPTLSDSVTLFHADHGNLAASGAAPTIALIDAAAVAIASQTAPGTDAEPLDINPAVALTHRSLNGAMVELINAEFNDDSQKNQRKPNRVRGIVDDIVASVRLSSTTAWYLLADPRISAVLEVVFLNGQREPRVVQAENFKTAGLDWRVELPFGVGAIGYRGIYKNPGA